MAEGSHFCPNCGSYSLVFNSPAYRLSPSQARCAACAFIVNYVKFTCGCCWPDIFAFCGKLECDPRGTPTSTACIPN